MSRRLCFIKDNFAYFTDNFESQTGDDWNDKPYQYNAGLPSTHSSSIKRIAFDSPLETPDEKYNKDFSVNEINSGVVPWLSGENENDSIYAGTRWEEFIDKVISLDGEIYLRLRR